MEELADRLIRMGMPGTRISILDALACLTEDELAALRRSLPMYMPEPTPAQRGALDRYQDKKHYDHN